MYGERERERKRERERERQRQRQREWESGGERPSSLLVSVVLGLEECTLLAV